MKLYKNGIDLLPNLKAFIRDFESLFIFVPYIKLQALKDLLDEVDNCKAIFVRWDTKDLIAGVSDLEIYQYCKENSISLFRNSRLHLKAYVSSYQSCFLGSANISNRALNLDATSNYNYELATIVQNLSIEDRLYFSIIEQESTLITDNIYNQFVQQLPNKKKNFPDEDDFKIDIVAPDKNFLISSLPLTYNVDTLCRVYETMNFINEVELNCVTHDLALYKLPFGLPINIFKDRLKSAFFAHPFIIAFLRKLDERSEIYFGEAKAWIHANCSDVPLPRRWEITENIQILYQWIVKLSDGKYKIDRPNYSERLYKDAV